VGKTEYSDEYCTNEYSSNEYSDEYSDEYSGESELSGCVRIAQLKVHYSVSL
jgi:hypothetical protein